MLDACVKCGNLQKAVEVFKGMRRSGQSLGVRLVGRLAGWVAEVGAGLVSGAVALILSWKSYPGEKYWKKEGRSFFHLAQVTRASTRTRSSTLP